MDGAVMVSGRKRNTTRQVAAGKRSEPYTTRIIKAGALLGDTKTLLSHWDSTQTTQENLRRFREENLFGKASRSRVEDILGIFRQRYLTEEAVTKALVVLGSQAVPDRQP